MRSQTKSISNNHGDGDHHHHHHYHYDASNRYFPHSPSSSSAPPKIQLRHKHQQEQPLNLKRPDAKEPVAKQTFQFPKTESDKTSRRLSSLIREKPTHAVNPPSFDLDDDQQVQQVQQPISSDELLSEDLQGIFQMLREYNALAGITLRWKPAIQTFEINSSSRFKPDNNLLVKSTPAGTRLLLRFTYKYFLLWGISVPDEMLIIRAGRPDFTTGPVAQTNSPGTPIAPGEISSGNRNDRSCSTSVEPAVTDPESPYDSVSSDVTVCLVLVEIASRYPMEQPHIAILYFRVQQSFSWYRQLYQEASITANVSGASAAAASHSNQPPSSSSSSSSDSNSFKRKSSDSSNSPPPSLPSSSLPSSSLPSSSLPSSSLPSSTSPPVFLHDALPLTLLQPSVATSLVLREPWSPSISLVAFITRLSAFLREQLVSHSLNYEYKKPEPLPTAVVTVPDRAAPDAVTPGISEDQCRYSHTGLVDTRTDKYQASRTISDTVSSRYPWLSLSGVLLLSLTLRIIVGTQPHSGEFNKPIFGDYECHRHWKEIVINRSLNQWYSRIDYLNITTTTTTTEAILTEQQQSKQNKHLEQESGKPAGFGRYYGSSSWNSSNSSSKGQASTAPVLYWNLDYPPLSAYHEWIMGKIIQWVEPNSVADKESSYGYLTVSNKVLMRWTVILSDLLIFHSAAVVFWGSAVVPENKPINTIANRFFTVSHRLPSSSSPNGYFLFSGFNPSNLTRESRLLCLLLFLCFPALVLVDHGHFQYNCVSIGLFLWSFNCISFGYDRLAVFFYSCAVLYKQTLLYFLPCFISLILGKLLHQVEFQGWIVYSVKMKRQKQQLYNAIRRLFVLAAVAAGTVLVVLLPFLISGTPDDFRPSDVVPKTFIYRVTSIVGLKPLLPILQRIFPTNRGFYEDYAATFWIAVRPIIKMNKLVKESRSTASLISMGLTFAFAIPPCFSLFRMPTLNRFKYALICCSLSFFLFSPQIHEKAVLLPSVVALLLLPIHYNFSVLFGFVASLSLLHLMVKDYLVAPFVGLMIIWMVAAFSFKRSICSGSTEDTADVVDSTSKCQQQQQILPSFFLNFLKSTSDDDDGGWNVFLSLQDFYSIWSSLLLLSSSSSMRNSFIISSSSHSKSLQSSFKRVFQKEILNHTVCSSSEALIIIIMLLYVTLSFAQAFISPPFRYPYFHVYLQCTFSCVLFICFGWITVYFLHLSADVDIDDSFLDATKILLSGPVEPSVKLQEQQQQEKCNK